MKEIIQILTEFTFLYKTVIWTPKTGNNRESKYNLRKVRTRCPGVLLR